MKREQFLNIIIWCSVLGILLSAYMTYRHYAEGEAFCNISATINCDIVNKSIYSVDPVFGIPVAILGIVVYSIIGALALYAIKNKSVFDIDLSFTLVILSFAAVAFSVYLTYAEIFLLRAICPFCIVSFITILTIGILAVLVWRAENYV